MAQQLKSHPVKDSALHDHDDDHAPAGAFADEVESELPTLDASVFSQPLQPGRRIYTDGTSADRPGPVGSRALGVALITLSYTLWLDLFILINVVAALTVLGLLHGAWASAVVLAVALLWGSLLLPAPKPYSSWFLMHPAWRHVRRAFRFSFVYDELPIPGKQYLYLHVPHAAFPVGQVVCSTIAPHILGADHRNYGGASDNVLVIPWYRHFLAWMGMVSVSSTSMLRALKSGGSVSIVPGGLAGTVLLPIHLAFALACSIGNRTSIIGLCVRRSQHAPAAALVRSVAWSLFHASLLGSWLLIHCCLGALLVAHRPARISDCRHGRDVQASPAQGRHRAEEPPGRHSPGNGGRR